MRYVPGAIFTATLAAGSRSATVVLSAATLAPDLMAAVVARLDAALKEVLASEDIRRRLLQSGSTPVQSSPELFGRQIAADFARWKKVILESRLRLEA